MPTKCLRKVNIVVKLTITVPVLCELLQRLISKSHQKSPKIPGNAEGVCSLDEYKGCYALYVIRHCGKYLNNLMAAFLVQFLTIIRRRLNEYC